MPDEVFEIDIRETVPGLAPLRRTFAGDREVTVAYLKAVIEELQQQQPPATPAPAGDGDVDWWPLRKPQALKRED
jgi:hypothetical protein